MNYLQKMGELTRHSQNNDLRILAQFVMDWQHLQVGGSFLPDLIEFYNWLHSSFAITIEKASVYKIGNVIKKFVNISSKEFAKHLSDLYNKVKLGFNKYVKLIDESLVSFDGEILVLEDETPLIHLLSSKYIKSNNIVK